VILRALQQQQQQQIKEKNQQNTLNSCKIKVVFFLTTRSCETCRFASFKSTWRRFSPIPETYA
jgi:hypothetical protein